MGTLCGASADLPVYRASDVRSHTSKEKGIWVSYKDGVFDITNFVVNHPGGSDKIMLAAGKEIGPFWRLYPQHLRTPFPLDILESILISGNMLKHLEQTC